MKTLVKAILLSFTLVLSDEASAVSGGDDLMNALGSQEAAKGLDRSKFKLNDIFADDFHSVFVAEASLPFEIRQWGLKILSGRYDEAAHLWTAIQKEMPDRFLETARAAHLYSLWKLELSQTFFNAWMDALRSKDFRRSRLGLSLEKTIAPGFDEWLLNAAIILSSDQESLIESFDAASGDIILNLKAYASLRRGILGVALIERLPAENALKIPLIESVILAMARAGDLAKAAPLLKHHLEPALEKRNDPHLLAAHYLQIARLLYQAGMLEGAAQYYLKIPRGAPSFLDAHEELTWVWLRQGDLSKLRGELTSLKSPIYTKRFSPELYLVRAISDLKLCFYEEVRKDFHEFVARNGVWAKEITEALKSENPPAPAEKDFYTRLLERAVHNRETEVKKLKALGEESIAASLPAVGFQAHWQKSLASMQAAMGGLEKARAAEYRRQWKNRQFILSEAIRKMQFVRVEVLSQLNQLAKAQGLESAEIAQKGDSVPRPNEGAKKMGEGSDLVFPFDGVYWPDELFRLRSVTESLCLRR